MFVLNNRKATQEYKDATTIETGLCRRAEVTVANQAVYVQYLISPTNEAGQAYWTPGSSEVTSPGVFVPPGCRRTAIKGLFGCRVRSVLTDAQIAELEAKKEGLAPQVTILLYGINE